MACFGFEISKVDYFYVDASPKDELDEIISERFIDIETTSPQYSKQL